MENIVNIVNNVVQDIFEVIPLIKDIGKDNEEIAEGLTDETYEEYTGNKPEHNDDNNNRRI